MKSVIIELQYLPPIEYFVVLQQAERVILEQFENYVKQSYRNRCYINTSQGTEMLIVPVTNKGGKMLMTDLEIDYSQKWQNNHWRTFESAYRNAPFFEFYCDDLKSIIYRDHPKLLDLNLELLSFCLRNTAITTPLETSTFYEKEVPEGILDLRSAITPKKPHSERPYYLPFRYHQVFGNSFADNLSILDLLFCMGPQSGSIISNSWKAI